MPVGSETVSIPSGNMLASNALPALVTARSLTRLPAGSPNREQGMENLLVVQEKWGSSYPKAVQPWLEKWELLSPFFEYPASIRKVMYTTNTVEGYCRQVCKVTKTKGAFSADVALQKLV